MIGNKRNSEAGTGGHGSYTPSGTFVLPLACLSEENASMQESGLAYRGAKKQKTALTHREAAGMTGRRRAEATHLEVSLEAKRARLQPGSGTAAGQRLSELHARVLKRQREPAATSSAEGDGGETSGKRPCHRPYCTKPLTEAQKAMIATNKKEAEERKRAKCKEKETQERPLEKEPVF